MRWVTFVLLIVIAIGSLDAAGRLLLHGRTSTTLVHGKGRDALFVFLPGILAEARVQSQEVIDTWLSYGDVLLIDYRGKRFDGDATARVVADRVRALVGYRKVVFVGASLGGLVAYDAYEQLKQDNADESKFDFIILDAPTTGTIYKRRWTRLP